jgi:hypothetical protein
MKRAILAVLTLSFFWLWLLFADRFFDSSPDGLILSHGHGLSATLEQFGVSLYSPAYFVWLGYERTHPSRAVIDRGPLLVFCLLQLWPLAVLIFRPWPQLSLALRRVIIGYSAACALVTVCGFFLLRHFSSTFTA